MTEQELLAAACAGDEDAFRRLLEPHHAALHAHCYRMLGSVDDAEDALQDVLLRVWRGLCRFRHRGALRNWLYRIATNSCLDALKRRPDRVPLIKSGRPRAESVWLEPYPREILGIEDGYAAPAACHEQREAVEVAFVAALQHLPPRQRAVLILREVLGFSAEEVAQALGTTVAAVNSALQRARKALDERPRESSRQATMRSLSDERLRELARNLVDAFEGGDVDAIVSLLAEDAASALSSYAARYHRSQRDRQLVAHARSAATAPHERVKAA